MITSKIRRGLQLLSRQRGQSLVELAIVTPLLLLLLLGLAEVGAALHSYLLVVNAAREGARYGSKDEFIANATIVDWVQNSTALPIKLDMGDGTYEIDGDQATIIVTRLVQTFPDGDYAYEIEDIEGNPYCEGACGEEGRQSIITPAWLYQEAIEAEAVWGGSPPNVNMKFIAVEVIYDHPQISGIFYIGRYLPNPIPLHGTTLMRVGGSRNLTCDVYPIAIHEDTLAGKKEGDDLGDIMNGFGSGNFGWVRWPKETTAGSAEYLRRALKNPRLSRTDFENAEDPDDHWLNTGDWVWGNTGISASVDDEIHDLMAKDEILVPVWDTSNEMTGGNGSYHIIGFAWVKITGEDLPHDTISATFIRWDDECSGAAAH